MMSYLLIWTQGCKDVQPLVNQALSLSQVPLPEDLQGRKPK